MNDKAKFDAIMERLLKIEGTEGFTPMHLSVTVISSYLHKMAEANIIEYPTTMTQRGLDAAAICEEFDWKPSDKEIAQFVLDIVHPSEQKLMGIMLVTFRDKRDELLAKFKNVDISTEES